MASPKALAAIALTLIIAMPICLGYAMATEKVPYSSWESESKVNLSDTILNSEYPIFQLYDGPANNSNLKNGTLDYVEVSATPSSYPMMTVTSTSITFTANVWVDLSSYPYWEIIDDVSVSYKLNGDENGTYSKAGPSDWKISGNAGSIKFLSTHTFTLVSYTDDGNYADVSYGWKLPLANQGYSWTNYMENKTIRILISVPDNSTVSVDGACYQLKRVDGTITVEEHYYSPPYPLVKSMTLGNYDYVLVERTAEGFRFSGVMSWPGYGTNYRTYNTLSFEPSEAGYTQTLTVQTLGLRTTNTDAVFRVESTEITYSSFPMTKDCALDMNGLFPDKSYSLKFNSIGIYGDSVTIGSTAYGVSNGRINVGGVSVPLKGVEIVSKFNGNTYDLYIGGHYAGVTAAPASLYFDGEWSLTITGNILVLVNGEREQWAPGEFAFDKESLIAAIALVSVFAFIGIGMYGARSGAKVGLLLLICGGAALISMAML